MHTSYQRVIPASLLHSNDAVKAIQENQRFNGKLHESTVWIITQRLDSHGKNRMESVFACIGSVQLSVSLQRLGFRNRFSSWSFTVHVSKLLSTLRPLWQDVLAIALNGTRFLVKPKKHHWNPQTCTFHNKSNSQTQIQSEYVIRSKSFLNTLKLSRVFGLSDHNKQAAEKGW